MKKLLATSAAAALTLAGVVAGVQPAQAAGSTLNYGIGISPKSLEVRSSQYGNMAALFQAVYDGLTRAKPDGSIVPNLALSWQYDKTLTHLTMKLRKGVKFTNGEVFNAAAVKANLMAFQSGDSPDASNAASLKSVTFKASDPYTVTINLKDVDPAFLAYTARNMGLMQAPKTIGTDAAKSNPIGCGMYVYDNANSVAGSKYVFHKNTKYWNAKSIQWDNVTFPIIADATAQVNALKAGQMDASSIGTQDSAKALVAAGFADAPQFLDWWGLTFVDKAGRMGSALKDVRVRQAINYALDRNLILQSVANGQGKITSSVFASYSKGYDAKVASMYTYDVAKAKQLMADAGKSAGFTLEFGSTPLLGATLYQIIKDELAAINITVHYNDVPLGDFFSAILQPKYPVFWMRLERSGNDWQFVNFQLSRDAVWNPSGYGDATADALMSKIQHSQGAVQTKALKALNKYVTEQAWFAPVLVAQADFIYDSKVLKNVVAQAGNINPYLYNLKKA